jgi:hypothetical protein
MPRMFYNYKFLIQKPSQWGIKSLFLHCSNYQVEIFY